MLLHLRAYCFWYVCTAGTENACVPFRLMGHRLHQVYCPPLSKLLHSSAACYRLIVYVHVGIYIRVLDTPHVDQLEREKMY
jgi:hypothetical protein